jgi:hypothetical protein
VRVGVGVFRKPNSTAALLLKRFLPIDTRLAAFALMGTMETASALLRSVTGCRDTRGIALL